jgi:D-glycero-D-manno-heptose 1,7-bisphosphate phosphatase
MAQNRALFLDRDGVVNIDRGYVYRREDFVFRDGIFELANAAQALGYGLFIVTNQAGIARGYYSEADFLDLTHWMIAEFRQRQVSITNVYYCPYHPVHGRGRYRCDSPDRKPAPGMLFRARSDFNLDLASSVLIGDQVSDMQAAVAAGVGTRIWIDMRREGLDPVPDCYVAASLSEIQQKFFSDMGELRMALTVGRSEKNS